MEKNIFNLQGKKAIITGASKGIGEAVARGLANLGVDLAIVGTNQERTKKVAKEIAQEYSVNTIDIIADVSNPIDVENMVEKAVNEFEIIDFAFNNAGVCIHQSALDMTFAQWKQVIDINLTGVFLCSQALAKVMIKQKRGSIINMASMSAGIVNVPQPQAAYNASKAGVVHLTKSLAVEWVDYNIRVNAISPGYINTPMSSEERDDWKSAWMNQSVMKRMGEADELTGAVVYFASDTSSFTTGSNLIIDGGFSCV